VSLPHGWGHDAEGARLSVAARHAGVNSNLLADEAEVDPLSGNAVLNGIPVSVVAAEGVIAAAPRGGAATSAPGGVVGAAVPEGVAAAS
jgi:hypothetical protein